MVAFENLHFSTSDGGCKRGVFLARPQQGRDAETPVAIIRFAEAVPSSNLKSPVQTPIYLMCFLRVRLYRFGASASSGCFFV